MCNTVVLKLARYQIIFERRERLKTSSRRLMEEQIKKTRS